MPLVGLEFVEDFQQQFQTHISLSLREVNLSINHFLIPIYNFIFLNGYSIQLSNTVSTNYTLLLKSRFAFYKQYLMKITIILLLIFLSTQDSIFHKILLPANGSALCLDGSPGAYYISQGTGVNKTKFILHFEGGGWCGSSTLSSTLQSCYSRSNSTLGSSKQYPNTSNLVNYGILSGDQSKNPGFYDWTRVFFKYCDGSGHQGTRSQPVNFKDKKLYFRGQNITIGQIQGVNSSHNMLTQATHIIVTGGSAGGLAVFLWANYVAEHAKGKVVAVPDSGIFLDVASVKTKNHDYRTKFINLMNFSNSQVHTPVTECNKAHPTQIWRCMFAENLYQYVKIPLFAVQSLYDSWSAPNILSISCIDNHSLAHCSQNDRNSLEQYQKQTRTVLTRIAGIKGNGVWAPACSDHCYMHSNSWNDKKTFAIPVGSNFSVQESVFRWYLNVSLSQNHIHIDSKSWPSNSGCSGAISSLQESFVQE